MADDLTPAARDLYEQDFLAWTEQQAQALRARRGGQNALDWDNVAEEIEDLGKSEFRGCESQVENIVEHLLKIEFVGPAQTIPHWRKEVRQFRRDLAKRLTPTIQNRLQPQLQDVFKYVTKLLADEGLWDGHGTAPEDCPYSWQEIVDPDWWPVPRYEA